MAAWLELPEQTLLCVGMFCLSQQHPASVPLTCAPSAPARLYSTRGTATAQQCAQGGKHGGGLPRGGRHCRDLSQRPVLHQPAGSPGIQRQQQGGGDGRAGLGAARSPPSAAPRGAMPIQAGPPARPGQPVVPAVQGCAGACRGAPAPWARSGEVPHPRGHLAPGRRGAPCSAPGPAPTRCSEHTVLSTRPRTTAQLPLSPSAPGCAQPVFPAPHLKANPSQPHSPQGTEPVGPRRGVGSSSGAPAFLDPQMRLAKISELLAQSWGREVSLPHWAGTWGH